MAARIAHLISARHVPGSAILGLSFTNKAARELRERVRKLAQGTGDGLTVTTFHSLCVRILREHAHRIGFRSDFTILDENDQKDVLREIFKNLRIDDRKFDLDRVKFEIGQAKNRLLPAHEIEQDLLASRRLPEDYALAAAQSFGKYQEQLKLLNAMDFDDLLYHAVGLLEGDAEVRGHYNARFRHILVDEYQDTNPTQFRLLRLLTERSQNLCVVGDDDQSIYAWRGADPSHILGFESHYKGARRITLEQNYRSTTSILEAANQVIRNNRARHPKSLWSERGHGTPPLEVILEDDRAEAEWVADEISRRAQGGEGKAKRPWRDFAVLYRSNAQSRVFEEALRRLRVPYQIVGGMSFLDRKEVKDTLSYWRLVANPSDDASLRRVINWPARGLGKTSIETLGSHAFAAGTPLFEALGEAPRLLNRGAAAGGALALRELITELRRELEATPLQSEALAAWGRRSFEKIGVRRALEAEPDLDPVRLQRQWENVEELAHALGQIRSAADLEHAPSGATGLSALHEVLSRLTLAAQEEDDEDESPKDEVTLLTLHGAKGLEYPVVFLVGLEEGFLPHRRTIDEGKDFGEERRLCYVGITRAKDDLVFTRARNRIRYGKPVPRLRSRFLGEISEGDILTRDESNGPDATDSKAAREVHEAKVKDYLAGIRKALGQPNQ